MAALSSVIRASAKIAIPSLSEVLTQYPCTDINTRHISQTRTTVSNIFSGKDDRLLVVIGPCSIHDTDAALDYAEKLAIQAKSYDQQLHIVMRTYFEKPRTTVGWKGLIFDPHLDGSDELATGLISARKFLLEINKLGLGAATEFLDITSFLYLADLISWGAIGARTTESQVHRQMSSGLPCPVGFKNGTDGNLKIAADAMESASAPHLYPIPDLDGGMCAIKSKGNPDCHVILRGGKTPNYYQEDIEQATELLVKRGLCPRLMVDCSHGNSRKSHKNQLKVANNICNQLAEGSYDIAAVMAESFLVEGKQSINPGQALTYGQSITDACLHWQDTKKLLETLAEGVEARRHMAQLVRHFA